VTASASIAARAAFVADSPFVVGTHTVLGDEDAHHIRVLRLAVGDRVALRDGVGNTGAGILVRVSKSQALVEVDEVGYVEPPLPIHLLVPVADRERMLWLAEKAAELNVTSWRPVLWQRSKSVSPRGEGVTYRAKVRARMLSAMLQSRSAWIPDIFPESPPERAITALSPDGVRLTLDAAGEPIPAVPVVAPVTLAIGPEGGFEPSELEVLANAGFRACTLGPSVLRFETAAVAAIAVARSLLLTTVAR
jgi:16S rRNA (uracil1498-N3)-methyltransferase